MNLTTQDPATPVQYRFPGPVHIRIRFLYSSLDESFDLPSNLARLCGISVGTMSDMLAGRCPFTPEIMMAIARDKGVDAHWLLMAEGRLWRDTGHALSPLYRTIPTHLRTTIEGILSFEHDLFDTVSNLPSSKRLGHLKEYMDRCQEFLQNPAVSDPAFRVQIAETLLSAICRVAFAFDVIRDLARYATHIKLYPLLKENDPT